MLRGKLALLTTSVALGMSAPCAFAAEGVSSQKPQVSGNAVEEIVVTARKREERLLDVPVAASALSTRVLERYQSSDLTLLATQVPQLQIDQASSGSRAIITLRGLGSTFNDAGIEQVVSINIDGVPISRGSAVAEASFDQESVQVFKGPQALYYGKNSPAGVIVLTSKSPGSEFEGYARAGYEFVSDRTYAEGAVSLPITNGLAARIAVHASNMNGGHIKNVAGPITDPALLPLNLRIAGITLPGAPQRKYPGTDVLSGRVTVVFTPNDRFDGTMKFLASRYRDDGITGQNVFFHCGGGRTKPSVVDFGGSGQQLTDPYGSCSPNGGVSAVGTVPAFFASHFPGSRGAIPFDKYITKIGSLVLNYRLTPEILLTSTTGWYRIDQTAFATLDGTTFAEATGRNDDSNEAWSEELRLVTSFNNAWNFSGGVFLEGAKRSFLQNTMLGYLGLDPATGYSQYSSSADTFSGNTFSAFGELIWRITPALEFAGGARYSHETKSGDVGNTYIFPGRSAGLLPAGVRLHPDFSVNNVSPQATLTWHITPDVMIYGAYKTGFKSGGIQTPTRYAATATSQNVIFQEETVHGGEGGLKFSQLGGALTGDVTVYHYDYKGLQLTAYDVPTALFFTRNAGAASNDGVEANLNYAASDELSLRGSLAYNKTRYTDFPNAQCYTGQTAAQGCIAGLQNLNGAPLPRAPHWTAVVGASWRRPLGDGWTVALDGDFKLVTEYQGSTNNNPFSWQKGYQTFNASARLLKDDWELALIGTNIGDTLYAVIKQDQVLGPAGNINGYLGQRREVSLQVTRRF